MQSPSVKKLLSLPKQPLKLNGEQLPVEGSNKYRTDGGAELQRDPSSRTCIQVVAKKKE